ncbi:MAG: hypothetical protein OXS47_08225 [Chloroflexota bacterium]|nr:hypothetical protein [Chloroflexota bacterium]
MDNAKGQDTYTPEQRETLESGLRTLARIIAREHLRRQEVPVGEESSKSRAHVQEDELE